MKEKKVLSDTDFLEYVQFFKKYSYLPSSLFLKNDISRHFELSDNQIRLLDELGILDWKIFLSSRYFTEKFLREFANKIDWDIILSRHKFSESFIEEMNLMKKYVVVITQYQTLSEKFLIANLSYFTPRCFQNIVAYQKISEDFIRKYIHPKISGDIMINLIHKHKLPEDYLKQYSGYISCWNSVLLYQKHISFDFIDQYKNSFNWNHLLELHYDSPISLKRWKKYIRYVSTDKIKYVLNDQFRKIKNNGLKKLLNQELLIRTL
jgi:hypothetical protein